MKAVSDMALNSLGKELIYEGRLQKEEVDREKKTEVHNILVLEQAKEKLVSYFISEQFEKIGTQDRRIWDRYRNRRVK